MDKDFTFDADTHTYYINGQPLISVTQLLKKHGLAPDYDHVSEETMEKAADRGKLIHKEIEDYITRGEVGFTPELVSFIERFNSLKPTLAVCEVAVHNDLVAGRIDLYLTFGDSTDVTIVDLKTTASINFEYVSWQLSLYAFLSNVSYFPKRLYRVVRLQEWHFLPDGSLKVVDIPMQPVEEIERLLECERTGKTYSRNLDGIVTDAQVAEIEYAESIIAEYDRKKKEAEANLAQLKAPLIDEMAKRGIKSFETGRVKLTYVLPQERTTIDSARLKKELPNIAAQYSKTTTTAASLRITFKEDK